MTDGSERPAAHQPPFPTGSPAGPPPLGSGDPARPGSPTPEGAATPDAGWSRPAQPYQPASPAQPYPGPQRPSDPYHQQPNPPTAQVPGYPPTDPYPGGRPPPYGVGAPGTAVAPETRRRSRRGGPLVAAAVALTIIAGGVGGGVGVALNQQSPTAVTALSSATPKVQPAALVPGSAAQVAAKVLPSVVQIQVIMGGQGGQSGEGSGVVLSPDGLILTNNHVVEMAAGGGGTLTVTLKDGTSASATIVGRDPSADIAVIKMANQSTLTPIAIGSSANLVVGQNVVAVGSPLGLVDTVTSGIISALNRPVSADGAASGQSSVLDAIQTDAAINPGNSGGALVNMNGQLVGINSAIASLGGSSSVGGQSGSIGLGCAIPVDQANRIAQELITQGTATQAVLGVSITATTPRAALTTHGATIAAVSPGGPADKAGITAGSVVTKVNDRLIPDGDSLVAAIRSHAPGDSLTLTLTGTHGAARTVHVTLGGITVQAGR